MVASLITHSAGSVLTVTKVDEDELLTTNEAASSSFIVLNSCVAVEGAISVKLELLHGGDVSRHNFVSFSSSTDLVVVAAWLSSNVD